MKKTMVISFIAAAMLLIPCTACHVAESHNEVLAQENKENTVNGDIPLQILLTPLKFKVTLSSKAVNILPILWLFIRLHLPIIPQTTLQIRQKSKPIWKVRGKNITRILPLFIRLLSLTGKRHQRVPFAKLKNELS